MSLKRHPQNPLITRLDIPEIQPGLADVSAVFNPGAVLFEDKTILLLRVQNRGRESFMVVAESDDGVSFTVRPQIVELIGLESVKETIYHIYDPRITKIGFDYYIMFAMDLEKECRLGLAHTADFERFEFMGIVSQEDNRNGVLFPEKINGKYLRFDRPNRLNLPGGPHSGDMIWISESKDLLKWIPVSPVMTGRWRYWDEIVGAGPPPVKTREGWLLLYHGVATHLSTAYIYQAGAALFDLENPLELLARSRYNILEPRELYELTGQVPNVVFPSGMVVFDIDDDGFASTDSRVNIYYGAADTTVCLAQTTVGSLIDACRAGSEKQL